MFVFKVQKAHVLCYICTCNDGRGTWGGGEEEGTKEDEGRTRMGTRTGRGQGQDEDGGEEAAFLCPLRSSRRSRFLCSI